MRKNWLLAIGWLLAVLGTTLLAGFISLYFLVLTGVILFSIFLLPEEARIILDAAGLGPLPSDKKSDTKDPNVK